MYLNQFNLDIILLDGDNRTTTDEGTDEKTKVSKRASRRGRGLSDSETTSAASADAAGPTDVVRRIQHRVVPVQPKGRIR